MLSDVTTMTVIYVHNECYKVTRNCQYWFAWCMTLQLWLWCIYIHMSAVESLKYSVIEVCFVSDAQWSFDRSSKRELELFASLVCPLFSKKSQIPSRYEIASPKLLRWGAGSSIVSPSLSSSLVSSRHMSLLTGPSSDMNSSSHVSSANSAHTGTSSSAEIKSSRSQVSSLSWSLPISSSSSWSPTFVCSSFSPWSMSKNGSLSDILKGWTIWKLLVRIPAFRKHFLIVRGYLPPSFSNPPNGM